MKLLFITLLLTSLLGKAQNQKKIDSLINNVLNDQKLIKLIHDPEISQVLKILDKELINYDFVNHNKSIKYIVLAPIEPNISSCSKTQEFIKSNQLSNKKLGWSNFTYAQLWTKSRGDTLTYITNVKNYLMDSYLPKDFHKLDKYKISLNNYAKKAKLERIIFYNYEINKRIRKVLKKNRKLKKEILNTLESHLGYYFNIKKKEIVLQSIYITDIVSGCNQYTYVEMDVFDQHYLFTIDKFKNSIVDFKTL